MWRRWRGVLACLCIGFALLPTLGAQAQLLLAERPSAAITSQADDLITFIDGVVAAAMQRDEIPGVTLAVIRGDQTILRGYGIAGEDQRGVDPETSMFRIGSISKTFVWAALAQLEADGILAFSDPINAHLPADLQISPRSGAREITIADLMDHRAGFEDWTFGHLFREKPEDLRGPRAYLAQFRPALVRDPGVGTAYSNYGAALAAAIIAEKRQTDWPSVAETHFFVPLSMQNASFREPYDPDLAQKSGLPAPISPKKAAQIAQGYANTPPNTAKSIEFITDIAGAGAASASAADMARWMRALLAPDSSPENIVPAALRARLAAVSRADLPGLRDGFLLYGLPNDQIGVGHSGGTTQFQSNMVLVPRLNLGVFVSTNRPTGADLTARLPGLIVEKLTQRPVLAPISAPKATDNPPNLTPFVGLYQPLRRNFTRPEALIGAFTALAIAPAPNGAIYAAMGQSGFKTLNPTADRLVFRAENTGQTVRFLEENGKIVGLIHPSGTMDARKLGPLEGPIFALGVFGAVGAIAAFSLLGGINRLIQRQQSTLSDRTAGLAGCAAALLILASFGCLGLGIAEATAQGADFIYKWPGMGLPTAAIAAWGALVAGVAAFGCTLWSLWRGKWPILRKIRALAASLSVISGAGLLAQFNLLGMQF